VLESWWWLGKSVVPAGCKVAGEELVVEAGLEGGDALPGMVAAAMALNTPTATTDPAAIQVVRSWRRRIAISRVLIRASVESIA